MENSTWSELSKELEAKEGGGIFLFIKGGRTKVRLVPLKGTENDERPSFWTDTVGAWNGQPNKRRIILGIVAETPGRTILNEDKNKVIPIVVAPTVLTQIVKVLDVGFDLFGATTGHAIAIERTGEGRGTTYRVDASPHAIALPDNIKYLDMNLHQLDAHYRELNGVSATGVVSDVNPSTNNPTEKNPPTQEADNSW